MSIWAKIAAVALVAVVGIGVAFAIIWMQGGSAPFQSVSRPGESPAPSAEAEKANWQVNCAAPQGKQECLVMQSLYGKKTQRVLVSAVVRNSRSTGQPLLLLRLPLGVYLPAGVSLQIGDEPKKGAKIETCVDQGCSTRVPVTENEIAALRRGAELVVSVLDKDRKVVTFEMPGGGFDKAYARLN